MKATIESALMLERSEDEIIQQAITILEQRMPHEPLRRLGCPGNVKDFLRLTYGSHHNEVFGVIWLNCRNEIIRHEELFHGTTTETRVYPREVLKSAIACNATGAIFYHNHPSLTCAEPSAADINLTHVLTAALGYIDCRVLDHEIVSGAHAFSFAENALL